MSSLEDRHAELHQPSLVGPYFCLAIRETSDDGSRNVLSVKDELAMHETFRMHDALPVVSVLGLTVPQIIRFRLQETLDSVSAFIGTGP